MQCGPWPKQVVHLYLIGSGSTYNSRLVGLTQTFKKQQRSNEVLFQNEALVADSQDTIILSKKPKMTCKVKKVCSEFESNLCNMITTKSKEIILKKYIVF